MSKLPLEGIRVVELTTGAAGPTVARVLCEFGAEVIRCETRLRGDGHRGEDPARWNKNPDFMKLQRGKKSFTNSFSFRILGASIFKTSKSSPLRNTQTGTVSAIFWL